MNQFDVASGFVTVREAARIAGITPGAMSRLCREQRVFCKRPLDSTDMPKAHGWIVKRAAAADYAVARAQPRQHDQPWARHL